MKIKEIRNMPDEELKKKLLELEEELVKNYAESASGTQVKSPGKIKQIKKTKARLKTVLKDRGSLDHE